MRKEKILFEVPKENLLQLLGGISLIISSFLKGNKRIICIGEKNQLSEK